MPARVVTFGTFTSINMVTSAKSDPVPEEALEKGVQLLDEELAALKSVLATTLRPRVNSLMSQSNLRPTTACAVELGPADPPTIPPGSPPAEANRGNRSR
jgi:hypothetical protein